MNPQLDQEKIHSREDVQTLRREGFTEKEIKRLSQLRSIRAELGVSLTAAEYQRLAFVRWLVATGKLSDELA